MKGSRNSEERFLYALKQAESGTPVGDVCRQMGISEATYFVWKKKDAGLGLTELRDKCLNVTEFTSIEHARSTLTAWHED